jgi:cytochrome bd-type quinol oxidase subunit 2
MAFPTKLSQLCTPAKLYFGVAVFGFVVAVLQNWGNRNTYQLFGHRASVPSCALLFAAKLAFILFWTWVLNLMCRDGHSNVAWLLVLTPFVLFGLAFFGLIRYQRDQQRKRA